MELTDRLLTLHPQAQLKVMERIFQKLSLSFGNQLVAKWHGLNMQDVYADWAEALADCSLAAINHGILISKTHPHPPAQGEFLAYCRQYNPVSNVLKIESKLSPEKIADNQRRIAEIAAMLARNKQA
jgi:hypothetical protein